MVDHYFNQVIDHARTNQRLGKTASGIAYQVVCAAGAAGAGGLVGGPLGSLIGTVAGAVYGYANSDNYPVSVYAGSVWNALFIFRSLYGIVSNLSDAEKEELATTIRELVGSASLSDFVEWFKNLSNQEAFMKTIFKLFGVKN